MIGAASSLQGQALDGSLALAEKVPLDVVLRRAGHRRQMLFVQAASCSLITLVLLVYCYAGTLPLVIA